MEKTMKQVRYILPMILLLVGGMAFGQQAKSAKEAFAWWFDHNCGIGQEDRMQALVDFSAELSPMLIQAFETGPDKGWVDKMTEAELRMVRANMEYVKKGNVAGLSKEDLEAFNNMDIGAYEQTFRNALTEGYKGTALNGLAGTRSEAARAYLGKMASDKRNPNAGTAQMLLQKMGQ
jgi:hypothetical protein